MIFTASIVTYYNDFQMVSKAIKGVLSSNLLIKLYVVDNSKTDELKQLDALDTKVSYIHNPSNPGFGSAHNMAIKLATKEGSKYHFIINPDTFFDGDVISPMINYMEQQKNVGMLMPRILNPDGSNQYLPKLLPSLLTIVLRKIKFPKKAYQNFVDTYELRFVDDHVVYKAPIISGCFTLLRLKAIADVGGYDDGYFMYFEDWDLSRRMNEKYDTIYFPRVSVYHEYASGANKNFKLFKIYLRSAFHYFNKWGWLFDKNRVVVNQKTLKQFQ